MIYFFDFINSLILFVQGPHTKIEYLKTEIPFPLMAKILRIISTKYSIFLKSFFNNYQISKNFSYNIFVLYYHSNHKIIMYILCIYHLLNQEKLKNHQLLRNIY